jgi:hypothetical protein
LDQYGNDGFVKGVWNQVIGGFETAISLNGHKNKRDLFQRRPKKAWAVSVGGYIFSHKSSVYGPGRVKDLAAYRHSSCVAISGNRIKTTNQVFFFMLHNFLYKKQPSLAFNHLL